MKNKYHTTSATFRRFTLAFLGLLITGTVYLTAYHQMSHLTGAVVTRSAQTITRPAEPAPRP